MKYLAAFLLFFCFVSEGFTQRSLNDYSFVIVPEKFDFVNEKDKYQLNSLTKFLFNKHGFNAYFDSERPDVKRCDGLYAEVDGKPAMIRTKVTVILKDCYGDEVYRTAVGKSKIKAYNKTYTAALRQAFLSIDSLDIKQKDPTIFGKDESVEETEKEIQTESETETMVVEETVKEEADSNVVETKDVLYTQNGTSFILKSTNTGYVLVERLNKGETVKGRIELQPDPPYKFEDPMGNKFPCYFDEDKNLIIETSFQNLVFTRKGQ